MRLPPLPDSYKTTRDALHQIAFFAVAPARYGAEGRMGLQAAPGGFGTPEFGGRVARVEGNTLVHEESGNLATQTITTVRAAAEFYGVEYEEKWFTDFRDPLTPVDPDLELDVDDTAARAIGQWFNFGFGLLERLGGHGDESDEVTEVQLWPEHFDPATEMGGADSGRRASYGASPGDPAHDEPYVYVAPWGEIDASNAYWNDEAFKGSSLGYAELLRARDPLETALEFLLEGYRILRST